ncbi:MAG TPA: type II toxin-antitoxin system VapC family toxin [Ktedonobacterales bacterium]|nr:type II toxin-antitoxin system VapC family toxin [Ktedonobacterales bacterium]
MKLLLDTHTFLWFLSDDAQLSTPARKLIEDGTNEIILSVASLWEMAIKISLGKLTIGGPFDTFITEQLALNSIGLLSITLAHTAAVAMLPFHHRDPFDRLLIAQSQVDSVPIVSRDAVLDTYGVVRMW